MMKTAMGPTRQIKAPTIRHDESGQMAVELAVVLPTLLVVLVIIIDGLVFASECARFDQLAPQRVISLAVSPAKDGYDSGARSAAVQAALEADFARKGSSVSVSCEDAGVPLASMTTYHCTFRFTPWPLSAAGAPAALTHSCDFSIDPYTPGELL